MISLFHFNRSEYFPIKNEVTATAGSKISVVVIIYPINPIKRNPNTNQTQAIKIVNADSFLSLVAQEAPNPSPNKSETIIQVVNIIIYLVVRTGFEPVSFLADV